MTLLVACASHLLIDLPLFGGPVITVAAGILFATRRERRRSPAQDCHEPLRP